MTKTAHQKTLRSPEKNNIKCLKNSIHIGHERVQVPSLPWSSFTPWPDESSGMTERHTPNHFDISICQDRDDPKQEHDTWKMPSSMNWFDSRNHWVSKSRLVISLDLFLLVYVQVHWHNYQAITNPDEAYCTAEYEIEVTFMLS